ncbi:sugar MFS transporter [Aestuariicella hydrocarbonica]|uniref:Sugar MFS transporter n=1 Tax=Pseudomaricurvus hydrocarbonicus TaxID=1470433 RepID=A0A9E5MKF5_9GAMM|nr:sugar MFS transporter [Aestuariicella hydrocarbonica]NHO66444.1 sugar MFS transporter [Aestuariicella hydrocarbonica]
MAEVIATNVEIDEPTSSNYTFALVTLTSLFFMWGFITCLNDILIPHLKTAFDLSYTQAMLVQFCFFGAYFVVSIPAGRLIKKIGYQHGIVIGLAIASIGCFLFIPAGSYHTYPLFLMALFVLASGITILQVSANPYVTALGSAGTASSRLTLTQAFNSLGTTIAPWFGAVLILSAATAGNEAASVKGPYVFLGLTLAGLALIFYCVRLPKITYREDAGSSRDSAWSHRHLVLGAVGIFVYVGAEVSIGSFLVNFLGEANIAGLPEPQAAKYITYYWGGAMVGRFIGAALMRQIPAGKVLAFNSCMAALLIAIAINSEGSTAMWSILAVGFFNSIMYPVIFSLALNQLGSATSHGSGILCCAIVGGAIIPVLHGMFADAVGLQLAFYLPLICYIYITHYGLKGCKPQKGSLPQIATTCVTATENVTGPGK